MWREGHLLRVDGEDVRLSVEYPRVEVDLLWHIHYNQFIFIVLCYYVLE